MGIEGAYEPPPPPAFWKRLCGQTLGQRLANVLDYAFLQPLWKASLVLNFVHAPPAILRLDDGVQSINIDSEFRAAQKGRVKDNATRILFQAYPNLAMI